MSTSSSTSPASLSEARALSAYGSRHGLFDNDSLYLAIARAENELKAGTFDVVAEQRLNEQINKIAKLVAPVTVDEILEGRRHRSKDFFSLTWKEAALRLAQKVRRGFIPTSVWIFCVTLIVIIIPLTTHFNRLAVLLADMKATEGQTYFVTLREARKLYVTQSANPAASNEQLGQLQDKTRTLYDLNSKISVNQLTISQMIEIPSGSPRWSTLIWGNYSGQTQIFSEQRKSETASDQPKSPLGSLIRVEPTTTVTPHSQVNAAPTSDKPKPPTVEGAVVSAPPDISQIPELPSSVSCIFNREVCDDLSYASSIGLSITEPDQIRTVYLTRQQAESFGALLGGSILPVLYGLLGASVYLMRRYLSGREEMQAIQQQHLGMDSYLRLGLGGISGLAIGWFWVPTSSTAVTEIAKLTTAPFALAFLAGFSIELLFSTLDRIIIAITPSKEIRSPTRRLGGSRLTAANTTSSVQHRQRQRR